MPIRRQTTQPHRSRGLRFESLERRDMLAGDLYVDDNWAGTPIGDDPDGAGPATAFGTDAFATIQGGVGAASTGDTVNVAAGTYSESNTHITAEGVTLQGAGTSSTVIDMSSLGGFRVGLYVDADDVTIRGLAIVNGDQGIRFEMAGGTIDGTQIDGVRFEDNASRGMDLHNATTVTNLNVVDSEFKNNGVGIRMASSSIVDGLSVTGSTFDTHSLAIYQANDNGTSTLRNLQVSDSSFLNSSHTAVFAEEIRDSQIESSLFVDNNRDITLFKEYTNAGVDVENLTIRNNTFTDSVDSSIIIWQRNSGLGGPITIANNTFNEDVGVMAANWGKIDIRMDPNFSHAPLTVEGNTVNFSGSFAAGATAAHAIKLRGGLDGVTIVNNVLNGGGVTDAGGVPPTSGIYIQTDDGTMGAIPASATIEITGNEVSGFVNGLSVYDPLAGLWGGLTSGATVRAKFNSIHGNSVLAVHNDPTSENVDASANWWSSIDPTTVSAMVAGAVDFTPVLDSGADTDTDQIGFQPDLSSVTVHTLGAQTGGVGRIQEGVDTVDGSTVNVAAGSYAEGPQIVINKDVSIVGEDRDTTILASTADTGASGDSRGWLLVQLGKELNLSNITLDGNGFKIWQGIRHRGTGTIDNVAFRNITFQVSGSPFAGIAVAAFGGVGAVDVTNSTFDNIGRVGVLYFGAGSGGTFSGNTYTGKGAGDHLDYAVEVGAGAVVEIADNTITGNLGVASTDGSTSAGVLVTTFFGAGTEANIHDNVVTGNTTGIAVGFDSADSSTVAIVDNVLTGNNTGVNIKAATAVLEGNDLSDNLESGLVVRSGGLVDAGGGSLGSTGGNTFLGYVDGGPQAIRNKNGRPADTSLFTSPPDVFAMFNDFGTTNATMIEKIIEHFADDINQGLVVFTGQGASHRMRDQLFSLLAEQEEEK